MFRWTKESIEWYIDAAEYTHYPDILCEQLKEFFDKGDTVYDIGCGLGHVDLLLSPYVKQLIGVDVDAKVLKLMEQSIHQQNITNVKTMNTDWKELNGEICDTVLTCSFASLEKDMKQLLRLCRKRLIVAKRNAVENEDGFITEYNLRNGSNKDEIFLEQHGIPYKLKSFTADFGQPFKSEMDARRFISHYKLEPWKSVPDYSLKEYEISEQKDVKRQQPDFSSKYHYYLPNHKEVHIIVIDK